jgi:hypothetical protein
MATKKNTPAVSTNAVAFVIVNGQQINIDVDAIALDALIDEMVTATANEYGSHIRIAAKLNELMPFAWYDIEHLEKSDNATVFAPHKTTVLNGFKAAGHSNPSVPLKRIREYGRNMRAGLAPNGKAFANGDPLPEGEGEGEGANPAKRSDKLFAVEESVKLWKRMSKSDDKALQAYGAELAALIKAHLKLDVATVK